MPKKEPLYPHVPKGAPTGEKLSETNRRKLRNLIEAQIRDEERAIREYHDLVIRVDAVSEESHVNLIALSNSLRKIADDEENHKSALELWSTLFTQPYPS